VAIVQTVYELACTYSDNRPGYKPVSDRRLVRPEHGGPR